jgi:hypothetical protein
MQLNIGPIEVFLNLRVVCDYLNLDGLGYSENVFFELHSNFSGLLLTKIHETSGDLFLLVNHDRLNRLNQRCTTFNVNVSVASVGGNYQILVYSNCVMFSDWDKLCAKLVL